MVVREKSFRIQQVCEKLGYRHLSLVLDPSRPLGCCESPREAVSSMISPNGLVTELPIHAQIAQQIPLEMFSYFIGC